MASVFFRKQINSYCVQYCIGRNPDGSRKLKTEKLNRQKMSDRDILYIKMHYEQTEKEMADNIMLTFSQLIHGWKDRKDRYKVGYLEYCRSAHARSTYLQKKSLLKNSLLDAFGETPIDKIDFAMVNQYRIDRQSQVSDRTIDIEVHHVLFPALNFAAAMDILDSRKIPKMKRLAANNGRSSRPRALEKVEVKALLETVEDQPIYHSIFYILLNTGMRPGELIGDKIGGEPLRWQDVDLEKRIIHITDRLNWRPKTRQRRTIPISRTLLEYLLRLREKYPTALYVTRGTNYHTLLARCKRIFKKTGFSTDAGDPMRVTLNTLRHTFATQMLLHGVSPSKVSKIMGHAITDTTEIYAHILTEHVQGSTDCLIW